MTLTMNDTLNLLGNFYYKILVVNLDKDTYTPIKVLNYNWHKHKDKKFKLSAFLQAFISSDLIHPLDREEFLKFTTIENLRGLFTEKNTKVYFKYRRKIVGGDYRWVLLEMSTTEHFSLENKEVILSVRDVDDEVNGYSKYLIYGEPNVLFDTVTGFPKKFGANLNSIDLYRFGTGVVCIKLLALDSLRETLGETTCNELIRTKAYLLSKLVIPEFCYRIADDEFIAVIPYASKKSFADMVKSILDKFEEVDIDKYTVSLAHTSQYEKCNIWELIHLARRDEK